MENLSPELLVKIFQHLNSFQLLRVIPNVCHGWRNSCQVVWNQVTGLTIICIDTYRGCYEMKFNCEKFISITTSELLIDSYFISALKNCKNLKKLILISCSFLINDEVEFKTVLASRSC